MRLTLLSELRFYPKSTNELHLLLLKWDCREWNTTAGHEMRLTVCCVLLKSWHRRHSWEGLKGVYHGLSYSNPSECYSSRIALSTVSMDAELKSWLTLEHEFLISEKPRITQQILGFSGKVHMSSLTGLLTKIDDPYGKIDFTRPKK